MILSAQRSANAAMAVMHRAQCLQVRRSKSSGPSATLTIHEGVGRKVPVRLQARVQPCRVRPTNPTELSGTLRRTMSASEVVVRMISMPSGENVCGL